MLDTQEEAHAGTCGEKVMTLTTISSATMPLSHIVADNYVYDPSPATTDDDTEVVSYVRIDYDPTGADASFAGADGATGMTYTV